MRIVVAPDSFKGSLSAKQVGQTIKAAILREIPSADARVIPMADGGEGTVEAFLYATGGQHMNTVVTGPTGEKMASFYGLLGDGETVVLETAAIAGLTQVKADKRNPLQLTTYGLGEGFLHALEKGYRKFIVGLGGSATNDGGLGMLQALGVTFRDADGRAVEPVAAALSRIQSVDYSTVDQRVYEARIRVACDVNNPLCGPHGASRVYGAQKGATDAQIADLDTGLQQFANRIEAHLDAQFQNRPGAGAAGGLGFAFLTVGASLEAGASLVADVTDLRTNLQRADWLITGEGKTDSQTLHGKVPIFLAKLAQAAGVPTILLSGCLEGDLEELYDHFTSMHALPTGPMTLEASVEQAETLLYHQARNLARLWCSIKT